MIDLKMLQDCIQLPREGSRLDVMSHRIQQLSCDKLCSTNEEAGGFRIRQEKGDALFGADIRVPAEGRSFTTGRNLRGPKSCEGL